MNEVLWKMYLVFKALFYDERLSLISSSHLQVIIFIFCDCKSVFVMNKALLVDVKIPPRDIYMWDWTLLYCQVGRRLLLFGGTYCPYLLYVTGRCAREAFPREVSPDELTDNLLLLPSILVTQLALPVQRIRLSHSPGHAPRQSATNSITFFDASHSTVILLSTPAASPIDHFEHRTWVIGEDEEDERRR